MKYLFALLLPLCAHAANDLQVQAFKGTATFAGHPIRIGELLKSGGTLEVGAGEADFVDLRYSDGHRFRFKSKSKVKLSGGKSAEPTDFEIMSGKVFAYFSKTPSAQQIHIKTAAAVAGVRGTKFMMELDPQKGTYICVCDGTVHVEGLGDRAADGPREVGVDQDLWVKPGQKMELPKVSKNMSQMTQAEFTNMGL